MISGSGGSCKKRDKKRRERENSVIYKWYSLINFRRFCFQILSVYKVSLHGNNRYTYVAPLQSFNCIAVHTKHTAKKKIHASSGNRMQIKWLLTPVSLEKSLPGFNKKFQNSWQRYKSVKFTNVFDHIFNFQKMHAMKSFELNAVYFHAHSSRRHFITEFVSSMTHIYIYLKNTHNVNKMSVTLIYLK